MEFDHVVEKKQEQKAAAWLKLWSSRSPEQLSMQLAQKHRPGKMRRRAYGKVGLSIYAIESDTKINQMLLFVSPPLGELFFAGRKSEMKSQL